MPSLADVMALAPQNATSGGMFIRGRVTNMPSTAATGQTIKCWTEPWENIFSPIDEQYAKDALEAKYLNAKVKNLDGFEGTVFELIFDRSDAPHRWKAKARADDGAAENMWGIKALPALLINAEDVQPPSIRLVLPSHSQDYDEEPNDSDGEWHGSDSDDDAEAPATAAPPEAPKRPVEVASESLPMAQRKPKRKKSSNSSAAGAAGD